MAFKSSLPACVLHEDEHLLVVNKPPGWNTHSPSPYAGEGIYDWLKHREPRWASLAIIHRLDKETSGVMVFGKTPLANRSLTEQFTSRAARKKYLLLTDRVPHQCAFTVQTKIARSGDRYTSGARGEVAETRFRVISSTAAQTVIEAEPLTGRSHQIRVHASEQGFPILGDTLYGGTKADRMYLRADSLAVRHPVTREWMTFEAGSDFTSEVVPWSIRAATIDVDQTQAYRLIHGASDGWTDWYVDRFDEFLLSQSSGELSTDQQKHLASVPGVKAVYHRILERQVHRTAGVQISPRLVRGRAAPERFTIRENGANFELSFNEGYSVGLFLDQRDNRRRLLANHVAADFPLFPEGAAGREVLNVFAYTCGFSVGAAIAGARTTSLDLSKKYLEWGKRNFALNGLNSAQHDFIHGDAFDWLKRLAKKGREFDLVLLDPPTFSQSKERGVFRAEKDYGELVAAALPVLKAGGVLFVSTNAAGWEPEGFLASVTGALRGSRRTILQEHYVPQPADFPISRAEPAHLKTIWLRIA